MARPRSEEKRVALLNAAAAVVAGEGLGARTATVARMAAVAEGTLFRYFATKEALLDALYLHIKQALGDAMRIDFDPAAPLEERVRTLWNGYIDWGSANPAAIKALSQLIHADAVTTETRIRAAAIFPEVADVARACAILGAQVDQPDGFTDAVFMGLADSVMLFALQHPGQAEPIKAAGFQIFWRGITG